MRHSICLLLLLMLLPVHGAAQHRSRAEQKFPGMALEPGQTMADLGRGDRISQPAPAALQALETDEVLKVEVGDWLVMQPREQSDTGLIFYHGAETDPRVYARPLRAIAEQGHLVVAVTMPRYLAILKPYIADEVIERYPEIRRWGIAGHSMGGAMAAQYVSNRRAKVAGLMFWDAYPPANIDLSEIDAVVMQIYRTDTQGNAPDNFREVDHILPTHVLRVPIQGAEHTYFGDYVLARHRPAPDAQISLEEQLALVTASSIEFMRLVSQP